MNSQPKQDGRFVKIRNVFEWLQAQAALQRPVDNRQPPHAYMRRLLRKESA